MNSFNNGSYDVVNTSLISADFLSSENATKCNQRLPVLRYLIDDPRVHAYQVGDKILTQLFALIEMLTGIHGQR